MTVMAAVGLTMSAFAGEITVYENIPSRLKSYEQKQVDNAYMFLCDYVGATNKLGIDELTLKGVQIGTTNYPLYKLLKEEIVMVDSAGKRYSQTWWDSCEYHSEIGASSNNLIQLIMFDLAHVGQ